MQHSLGKAEERNDGREQSPDKGKSVDQEVRIRGDQLEIEDLLFYESLVQGRSVGSCARTTPGAELSSVKRIVQPNM